METENPLVTFMLFAYEQEHFIRDAVRSALKQTYEPLEIILSDDCSSDNTFEIIKKEVVSYRGPHKIILNQNEKNLGLAGHINRVFAMAKGQLFVMAAGDDISVPERTELLVNRWLDKNAPVDLVCSYFQEMDVEGKTTDRIEKNVVFVPDVKRPVHQWACGATGACVAYDRKLYDKYGPLDSRIIAEDWVFSFRAWVESEIAVVEKPLVCRRVHDKSISVIHRDVKSEQSKLTRRLLRKKAAENKLARVTDWLHSWQKSKKVIDRPVEKELEEYVELLKLEQQSYNAGRLQALKYALLSLHYYSGFKTAIRLIIRNVLHWH